MLILPRCKMSDSNHASNANNTQYSREMRGEDTTLEFSQDEISLIARMFRLVGQRWSLIAGRIPGRTAEEIEKYWTSKCASSSDQRPSFAQD